MRRREQMQIEVGDRIGFPPPRRKWKAYWKRDDSISSYFRVNRRVRARKTRWLLGLTVTRVTLLREDLKPITRNREANPITV